MSKSVKKCVTRDWERSKRNRRHVSNSSLFRWNSKRFDDLYRGFLFRRVRNSTLKKKKKHEIVKKKKNYMFNRILEADVELEIYALKDAKMCI